MNAIIPTLPQMAIVGFPCNQFGHQEPAANQTELLNGLKYVRPGSGYVPLFDIFKKIDVNGEKEDPLYSYLKESCRPPANASYYTPEIYVTSLKPNDITWNFEKFLINSSGVPMFRFLPDVEPVRLKRIIQAMANDQTTTEEYKNLLLDIDHYYKNGGNTPTEDDSTNTGSSS